MTSLVDQLIVLVMLINFAALGSGRLAVAIRAVALQGVILGILPVLIHSFSWHLVVITGGLILAKGIIIPWLLTGAIVRARISREMEPYLGYVPTLLIGAITTGLSFVFAARLPLAPEHQGLLFVPAAIATLLTGFIVLVTRRKAISQVIGYLMLENGIFLFGLLLTEAMPVMVEAGVLLDLIVGIFVMGIIINQISREFSSIDTSRLTTLRD
ncbi:hydrogenase [Geobacter hydrogenophilus]|uniref:Hydrogenase n=1 Tax=Geobacter hydrogenophilus TaxID=40983 RepID=A0A9W6LBY8_9BACT|nr:hydrogenase [Geobacter hydrogenophilus]MBT0894301.1 hydrogenase [Geobacter hydrogenophilus]GLI38412.1 hydrogenase [Geobacter hydrogenophilus]